MSTGLPAAPYGGIVINDSLLSMQASDSSTPEPPAPVMMTTFSPFGVGRIGTPRANSSMSRKERARVRTRSLGARRSAARLQHHDRLFLRHALCHFGERAAVLQIFAMLRDDLGVVVLLEKRQQIVLVDVGLVAEADDRGDAHLRRPRKADDRHADAAGL